MNQAHKQAFLDIIHTASHDKQLLEVFLTDLLTPGEFEEFVRRWQIVKALHAGTPQREIAKNLGISIATVTRGSRVLRDKQGGFNRVLDHQ